MPLDRRLMAENEAVINRPDDLIEDIDQDGTPSERILVRWIKILEGEKSSIRKFGDAISDYSGIMVLASVCIGVVLATALIVVKAITALYGWIF
jgi:hypothetical protein